MKHTEKYLQAKWVTENPDGYDERDIIDAKRYCNAYLEGYNQALTIANVVGRSDFKHNAIITDKKVEVISKFANVTKKTRLYNTRISIRCLNILILNKDKLNINVSPNMKLEELSKLSASKFLQCRNAGKRTLHELKELCFYANIELLP